MKSDSRRVLGTTCGLLLLAIAGCKSGRAAPRDNASKLQTSPDPASLMSYRMRSWTAPNDHTVIVESYDGTRYKAETMGPCLGLDFTTGLGFSNRGGFQQIDRFSSVVLADGTRCAFKSFGKVVTPAGSALDSLQKHEGSNEEKAGSQPDPH